MKKVLISGFGDIGMRVATRWHAQSAHITAICRNAKPAPGVDFLHLDLDHDIQTLAQLDLLYHFMPPPPQGQQDSRISHLLQAMPDRAPEKMVLISTSAVYGDSGGAWVDESAALNPGSDRGKRRADAERQWQQWAEQHDVAWVILRVPGIYGPGRLPIERLKKGMPMVPEADAPFTNRIHSEDLAEICYLAGIRDSMQGIYNASDGQPGNMTQYFNAVADACGLPRPPQISLEQAQQQLSPGMLSYLQESRRLSNARLLKDSGYQFKYPDLESGLKGSL